MSEEIKPCSICGRKPRTGSIPVQDESGNKFVLYNIYCIKGCRAIGNIFTNLEVAIKEWNQRA